MHSYNLSLKYVLLLLLTDGGAKEVGFLAGSSATHRHMKPWSESWLDSSFSEPQFSHF